MFGKLEERDWFDLYDDEEVEWWSHPSIVFYAPRLGLYSLVFVAGLAGLALGRPELPYIKFVYSLLTLTSLSYILYLLVHWRSIYYIVTSERVIRKEGIVSREINPANFSRISNIMSDVSILERFVSAFTPHDIGDVHIHTADDNLGDIHFDNVKNIDESRKAIQSNLSSYSSQSPENPEDE